MIRSKYLDNLIDSLTILPGVGRKSAERMAYQLLNINPQKSVHLSEQLKNIENKISRCLLCGIFLDQEEVNLQTDNSCHICERLNRDLSKICVTESTSDVYMINDSTSYNGYFFVLKGNLSPIDGRGPAEIGLDRLQNRLNTCDVKELILATSTTIEGEATAHYIRDMANKLKIKITRLAFGLPLNGEISYLDNETISHAFNERKVI